MTNKRKELVGKIERLANLQAEWFNPGRQETLDLWVKRLQKLDEEYESKSPIPRRNSKS